jgi:hypothetical protein
VKAKSRTIFFDGFVAHLSGIWTLCAGDLNTWILDFGVPYSDSRFTVQNPGRPGKKQTQSSPADCESTASEGSSTACTGYVGVLAIPPVRVCLHDTLGFFCEK